MVCELSRRRAWFNRLWPARTAWRATSVSGTGLVGLLRLGSVDRLLPLQRFSCVPRVYPPRAPAGPAVPRRSCSRSAASVFQRLRYAALHRALALTSFFFAVSAPLFGACVVQWKARKHCPSWRRQPLLVATTTLSWRVTAPGRSSAATGSIIGRAHGCAPALRGKAAQHVRQGTVIYLSVCLSVCPP